MKRLYEAVIQEIEENPDLELTAGEKKELQIIGENKTSFHTVTPNPDNTARDFIGVCAKHGLNTEKIRIAVNEAMA